MSFQRIFEMVRRQGMPMVVTDGSGKEPVVVLPFEVYEALMEGSPDPKPVISPAPVSQRLEQIAKPAEGGSAFGGEEPGLSLEERFYVVPMEDQENR